MAKKVKKSVGESRRAKRRYDSSRRKAQAEETRASILDAARELFVTHGYAGTTVKAISEAAGVAEETVYLSFGSKRDLMKGLLHIAVLGDPPVPFLDRPEIQAVIRERDQRRQIDMFSRAMTPVFESSSDLWSVMRSAEPTEPEIAAVVRDSMRGRLAGMGEFVTALLSNGTLRRGLEPSRAAELVWTLASPEIHRMLRRDLGWSVERYQGWLADSLQRVLLS
jgi:AcrR family transcriptional regulator